MPLIFCNFQLITYFCMINQTNKFRKPITITLLRADFYPRGARLRLGQTKINFLQHLFSCSIKLQPHLMGAR